MRGINLYEAAELALIYKYRSLDEKFVIENDVMEYARIINDNLEKQYGDIWYDRTGYNPNEVIFNYRDDKCMYVLKEPYTKYPKMISYVMMNYPLKIVMESQTENALNAIGLSKDEDNNIKRLILKKS